MEITWYGQTAFRLKERKVTVLTDPIEGRAALKSDIVIISQAETTNNLQKLDSGARVIDSPGEYEIGDIFISGVQLTARGKKANAVHNVFVIYMDDIAVCYLGNLGHLPTQQQVEDMGSIHVLLIPVGGVEALNAAQAAELISLIEPAIVIPMGYGGGDDASAEAVAKFLKEMGVSHGQPIDTLKLTKAQLPEETQIILLEPKG
jgi:L-ascorbate metabolism protein UlaG (beta-lactamase superfamily)